MERGTLTAQDKQEIKKQTGCIAQLRGRGGAGRQFTLKGPADQEEKAYQLCKELIEKNGNTGGRKSRDVLPRKPPHKAPAVKPPPGFEQIPPGNTSSAQPWWGPHPNNPFVQPQMMGCYWPGMWPVHYWPQETSTMNQQTTVGIEEEKAEEEEVEKEEARKGQIMRPPPCKTQKTTHDQSKSEHYEGATSKACPSTSSKPRAVSKEPAAPRSTTPKQHTDHGRGSRQHSKSVTDEEVAAEQHTDHGHRTTRKENNPKGSSNNDFGRGSTQHSKSNTAKEVAPNSTDQGPRTQEDAPAAKGRAPAAPAAHGPRPSQRQGGSCSAGRAEARAPP